MQELKQQRRTANAIVALFVVEPLLRKSSHASQSRLKFELACAPFNDVMDGHCIRIKRPSPNQASTCVLVSLAKGSDTIVKAGDALGDVMQCKQVGHPYQVGSLLKMHAQGLEALHRCWLNSCNGNVIGMCWYVSYLSWHTMSQERY
jgi:hypothetical protein